MVFANRSEAGRELAALLGGFEHARPIVFALPRGGVPVAVEVSRALHARLELLVVRKLAASASPELAVGAVAEDGTLVLDQATLRRIGMGERQLAVELELERVELARQAGRFRGNRPPALVSGRTVIVVDDGLATGLSDLAAVRALRRRGAARIIVAAPVGSREAVRMLHEEADAVVVHTVPSVLHGVGRWYEDFAAVSDEEVLELLVAAPGG